jgi:hypothetical protein
MVRWEDKQTQEQTLIPRLSSKEETSLILCVSVRTRLLETRLEVDNTSRQRHRVNTMLYLLTTVVLLFFVPSDAENNILCYSGFLLYQEAALLKRITSLLNCNKEEHSTDKQL